ncbi:flagellar motor protein MotD [Stenotrophobium rhamnosiphilum]|uniref:flagellar motor protein MotD n=1 Tax=Stenotrophobium rhamnosiphilum TaxID=2029166 RepID=UPI001374A126|nr:flagellar motor protein MotD [Stenotrophobium rhamnosiphilum]
MARKHKHEEHANHEAWAIPYGDLVTLLLALFVVMYAVSSVNEGKFRVLSDALSVAFGGPPKSLRPVQFGNNKSRGSDNDQKMSVLPAPAIDQSLGGILRDMHTPRTLPGSLKTMIPQHDVNSSGNTGYSEGARSLKRIAVEVQAAMAGLIKQGLVVVRPGSNWLEVEIKTDILYSSGSAEISHGAVSTLDKLSGILKPFPNVIRIEGHTDNVPINTRVFPSNWELSAARAASVVHLFMQRGVEPTRMSVEGLGEYRPIGDNKTALGRDQNRRVVLVILSGPDDRHAADFKAMTGALDQEEVESPVESIDTASAAEAVGTTGALTP